MGSAPCDGKSASAWPPGMTSPKPGEHEAAQDGLTAASRAYWCSHLASPKKEEEHNDNDYHENDPATDIHTHPLVCGRHVPGPLRAETFWDIGQNAIIDKHSPLFGGLLRATVLARSMTKGWRTSAASTWRSPSPTDDMGTTEMGWVDSRPLRSLATGRAETWRTPCIPCSRPCWLPSCTGELLR